MRRISFVLIATMCVGGVTVKAASPGDEVILVYNTRVPESKEVADYYAQRRQVPTNQIFGFALSTSEEFPRSEFEERLQRPLARALETEKLWHITSHAVRATNNQAAHLEWNVVHSKIRYAVLCYGVPLRIAEDPNLKEEGVEISRPEMRRNVAAVDSELSLLPRIEQKLPLAGPIRNSLFGATNESSFHPTNGLLLVS